MDVAAVAAALGKDGISTELRIDDIVRVIDNECEEAGLTGSVTGIYIGQAFPIECRMNSKPATPFVFAPDQLMIVDRPRSAQKAVDPSHAKTLTEANGARQSKLDYAVGSADPLATLAMAKVQAEGDAKYGKDNWRGISEADHLAHALTHIALHRAGDQDEAHLAHALTRLHMAMAVHLRPNYHGEWKPNE